jgi:CxxC-x17-CxxC domain-containing protein
VAYADKTLNCRDCGTPFTFTASEQQFYADRGFQNEPSRCPDCRQARKASGGGAPRSSSFGGDRRQREMVDVTCSSCGKETQVPFQPTAGRPVYCPDCFERERAAHPRNSYR